MIVSYDPRRRRVLLEDSLDGFIETVEFLEAVAPDDGFTRHLREQLDLIHPPTQEDDE